MQPHSYYQMKEAPPRYKMAATIASGNHGVILVLCCHDNSSQAGYKKKKWGPVFCFLLQWQYFMVLITYCLCSGEL